MFRKGWLEGDGLRELELGSAARYLGLAEHFRLHGEFKRRVKTQCALPNAETAAMLFWALMASGQITMRRVDGWQTLDQAPVKQPLDLAA